MRTNTRRYRRVDSAFVTKVVERHVDARKVRTLEAQMINLSVGGVYVQFNDPPPKGTIVEVHFSLPNRRDDVVALGLVRWSRRGRDAGMGVRFCHIEEGAKDDIELYVESAERLARKAAEITDAIGEDEVDDARKEDGP
jgi:uncharacterized protein (TIGR02266 family)